MSDMTMDVLYTAMNGLMTRQQVIANNMANLSTPGFQASQVDFESSLQAAMDSGNTPSGNTAVVTPTNDSANQNGNNVNVDRETMSLAETELRYQAVVGAMNTKFQILKTSIEG